MQETSLFDLVKELDRIASGQPIDDTRAVELCAVIENSYLDDPANVPTWLLDLFDALIHKRIVPPSPQTSAAGDGGSPYNFLVELADVVDMNYIEGGEYFIIQFPTIGVEAKISLEDSNYTVRSIE